MHGPNLMDMDCKSEVYVKNIAIIYQISLFVSISNVFLSV